MTTDNSDIIPPPVPPPVPPAIPPFSPILPQEPKPDRGERLGLPLTFVDTAVLVLLTVLADVCLYGPGGGLGGAALLVAVFSGLHILHGRVTRLNGLVVTPLVAAIAGMLVWYAWWLIVVVALVAILVIAVRLWRPEWSFLESLWASCGTILNAPNRLYGHLVAHHLRAADKGIKGIPGRVIAIPLAVSILFLIIFSAANPVVSEVFSRAWSRFGEWLSNLSDYLNFGRAIFWLGSALVFAALIRQGIYRLCGNGSDRLTHFPSSNSTAACPRPDQSLPISEYTIHPPAESGLAVHP